MSTMQSNTNKSNIFLLFFELNKTHATFNLKYQELKNNNCYRKKQF